MKTMISLTLLLFLTSFNMPKPEQTQKSTNEDFSWLLGSWQRTNEEEGRQTFEHWKKQSKHEFNGIGCTLKGGDTIWQEAMKLRKLGNHWNFEVVGKGDTESTVFTLTEMSDESFTCENPENEFPKVISYAKTATGLKAVISGGGPDIAFDFEKID